MSQKETKARLDMMRKQHAVRIDQMQEIKAKREDFMLAPGKGTGKDNASYQFIDLAPRRLFAKEVEALYRQNQLVQNIVNMPAEDLMRAGFRIEMENEDVAKAIEKKLTDLKVKEVFSKRRRYERMYGAGYVSMGVTQKSGQQGIDTPLDDRTVVSLDYLHPFSPQRVMGMEVNDDVFSMDYGKVEYYTLNQAGGKEAKVHTSRILLDQTRMLEGEKMGQSVLEPMMDVLTVFDTAVWSVGQILYDWTFKVYKTDGIKSLNQAEKEELRYLADYQFRTEALAIIAESEDLTKVGTPTSGLGELLDFAWETLAGMSLTPQTVLKGQAAGTIAGAQYDVMNYYNRISADQETEIRPDLERLVKIVMYSMGINPETTDWKLVFNPLWNLDQATEAGIKKTEAETYAIYIGSGVISAEDVRAWEFPEASDPEESLQMKPGFEAEQVADLIKQAQERQGGGADGTEGTTE